MWSSTRPDIRDWVVGLPRLVANSRGYGQISGGGDAQTGMGKNGEIVEELYELVQRPVWNGGANP